MYGQFRGASGVKFVEFDHVICFMHVISNCVICLPTNVVYGLRVRNKVIIIITKYKLMKKASLKYMFGSCCSNLLLWLFEKPIYVYS